MDGAESRRDLAQASRCPLLVELYRQGLILPATMCDNTWEALPNREVTLKSSNPGFLLGLSHIDSD